MKSVRTRSSWRILTWAAIFGATAWIGVVTLFGIAAQKEGIDFNFRWQWMAIAIGLLLLFVACATVLLGVLPLLLKKIMEKTYGHWPSEGASRRAAYFAFGALPATYACCLAVFWLHSKSAWDRWVVALAVLGTLGLWLAVFKDGKCRDRANLYVSALLVAGIAAMAPMTVPTIIVLASAATNAEFYRGLSIEEFIQMFVFIGPVAVAIHFIWRQAKAWLFSADEN